MNEKNEPGRGLHASPKTKAITSTIQRDNLCFVKALEDLTTLGFGFTLEQSAGWLQREDMHLNDTDVTQLNTMQ